MRPDLIAGRYRVLRAIGRGGMGTVWLCRDEVLGREVAVKQIGQLPGESATDTARAMREARSSAALNHRNVVSVFDVVDPGDSDDGHAWLVMEYVPSRTLGEITRDEGPLDPQRAARIGAQVADGLAAAHAAGTIHRDVKPGNILVTEDDVAKITDFGIARGANDAQLTQTGLVTGTPSYFSPELARGEDPGPESDVYALGATLYGAVEGKPPYPEQRNPIALLQKIAVEEPPPPTRAGALAGPISRMMDRDPTSRWSMEDAAGALHKVAERGDATEDTAVMAAPTAVAPAAGAATAGTAAAASTDEPRPVPAQEPNEDHGRRRAVPWLIAAAVLLVALLGVGAVALSGDEGEPEAGGAESPAASPSPTPSEQPRSREPSPTPEPSPTREQSQEPSQAPSPEKTPEDPGTEPVQAVNEYFSLMPGDPDAGWERLAPSMQEQGRDAYEDWWSSVESVELHSSEASDGSQVRVDLTYFFTDGSATRETQVLTMEESDGRYLIADDEVLSSRSVS
ncbi:MAG TPA: serine/threonine-protein kinase [Nocardioidaceae bacterium]